MSKIWLLVFIFNGQIYASGPHELETCREMLAAKAVAACVHKDLPSYRVASRATPKEEM